MVRRDRGYFSSRFAGFGGVVGDCVSEVGLVDVAGAGLTKTLTFLFYSNCTQTYTS